MHTWNFYGGNPAASELADIESCILNRSVDLDLIGFCDWIKALSTDDLPIDLITHILTHKDNPIIRPMYERLSTEILGILDK